MVCTKSMMVEKLNLERNSNVDLSLFTDMACGTRLAIDCDDRTWFGIFSLPIFRWRSRNQNIYFRLSFFGPMLGKQRPKKTHTEKSYRENKRDCTEGEKKLIFFHIAFFAKSWALLVRSAYATTNHACHHHHKTISENSIIFIPRFLAKCINYHRHHTKLQHVKPCTVSAL